MKKYNLSNIMKRAWQLVKKVGLTISLALKLSWKEAKEMTKFERGQVYQNEDSNIFIKAVYGGMVRFIEGYSPAAIHDMQEIPAENLEDYMNRYGFKRASAEMEAFINA